MTETMLMPLRGMTCSSCVSRISARLRRLDGVIRFQVDLTRETLSVELDRSRSDLPDVAGAVADAGYELDVNSAIAITDFPRESLTRRLLHRLSTG